MSKKHDTNEVIVAIRALYRRRYLIVFVGILGVAAGVGVELYLRTPQYTADIKLVHSSPRLGDEGLATYMPRNLHALDYKAIFESTDVIGTVWEQLVDSGAWSEAPEPPTIDTFADALSFSATMLDQTTRPVNYSPVFTLTAKAKRPELADQFVNAWCDAGIAAVRRAISLNIESAVGLVQSEANHSESEYEALLDRLASDSSEHNIMLLELELSKLVEQMGLVRSDIYDAERSLASSTRQLEVAGVALENEEPTVNLFHAPSDDVYWLQSAESGAEAADKDSRGMLRQSVNPVYVDLRTSENLALSAIASAEARIAELNEQYDGLSEVRGRLQQELATHTGIQRKLMNEAETAELLYAQLHRTESYLTAAKNIGLNLGGAERASLGVNRLSEQTYVREARSRIPGAAMAVLYGIAAAGLMGLWIIYSAVLVPLVSSAEDDVFV